MMNNLYLKIPSETDENEYLDYIKEFKEYEQDNKVFFISAQTSYKRWLKLIKLADRDTIDNDDRVTLYFFMKDDHIIGHVTIKHSLEEKDIFGNIGGCIRPTMRNKGYGKKMLSLALKECKNYDLDEVLVNCLNDNIPSNYNIKDNGGVLHSIISNGNEIYKQYKIKVKEN